ncbi:MAG TPA: hypothetical protein VIS78_00065 [Blastocatellia bacterium]
MDVMVIPLRVPCSGTLTARCIVVEDAPAGTEAARRAGMRTIGVLTTHAALEADRVVATLDELDDAAFNDLLDGERSKLGPLSQTEWS